jgi:hypothetical protein
MDNNIWDPAAYTLTVATTAASTSTITVNAIPSGMTAGTKFKVGNDPTIRTVATGGINTTAKTISFTPAMTIANSVGIPIKHELYDSVAGPGFAKLAVTAGMYDNVSGTATSADNDCKLKVYAKAVNNYQTFKVVLTDTESSSTYTDNVTLFDTSDPLQLEVFSPTGNAVKNGQGTVVVTATIKRNGTVVTTKADGTAYVAKYYRYDKDGKRDENFGGVGINYMTGTNITFQSVVYPNAIQVSASNINIKSTFVCEIS